jgi:diaminopimelate decarboxylase
MEYALKVGVIINIGALHTFEYYKDKLRGKNVYLRVNPKVGAGTSHHVITGGPKSKFGIYENDLLKAIKIAKENDIHIVGLHQHIGSNMKKHDEDIILQTMRYVF